MIVLSEEESVGCLDVYVRSLKIARSAVAKRPPEFVRLVIFFASLDYLVWAKLKLASRQTIIIHYSTYTYLIKCNQT